MVHVVAAGNSLIEDMTTSPDVFAYG